MSGQTPAPWHLIQGPPSDGYWIESGVNYVAKVQVATVRTLADAQLIAAAPDLAAALAKLLREIDIVGGPLSLGTTIDAARAALHKAGL
jgi:hypothetical protein